MSDRKTGCEIKIEERNSVTVWQAGDRKTGCEIISEKIVCKSFAIKGEKHYRIVYNISIMIWIPKGAQESWSN